MSSYDQRLVEMRFENSQFEAGAIESLRTLEKLQNALQMDEGITGFDNINEISNKMDLSMISAGVDELTKKFSTMGIIATTALMNITNKAVNAAEALVKSVAIDPIKQGFGEYELKLKSIQTIQSNTPNTIEEISGYLDELNTYADKTIYNFAQMTDNIGKFTAAGVDLETAVQAIQGMSNLSAMSGADTQQNARAMYNAAQALSSGAVRLIDWKSFENAGIGGLGFQKTLRETAKELGVATDVMAQMDAGTLSFRDSLQKAWVTNDVFLKALQKYSALDENGNPVGELATKAYEAATKIKTYTQLMDTLKESVGSGWAQTWEYVFGDIDEAKAMWTSLYDEVNGIIEKTTDARNLTLKTWKDLGGRDSMINAIANSWNGIKSVVTPVIKTVSEFIPKLDGRVLYSFSKRLEDSTKKMILSSDSMKTIEKTVRSAFSQLQSSGQISKNLKTISSGFGALGNIAVNTGKSLASVIASALPGLTQLGYNTIEGLTNIAASAANVVMIFAAKLEKSNFYNKLKDIGKGLGSFLSSLATGMSSLIQAATAGINFPSIGKLFEDIGSVLGSIASSKTVANLMGILGDIGSGVMTLAQRMANALTGTNWSSMLKLKMLVNMIVDTFRTSEYVTDGIKGRFAPWKMFGDLAMAIDDFADSMSESLQTGRLKSINSIGRALLELSAGLWIISTIDLGQLTQSFAVLSLLFQEIMAAYVKLITIYGLAGSAKGAGAITSIGAFFSNLGNVITQSIGYRIRGTPLNRAVTDLVKIGLAMMAVSSALKNISTIDSDKLMDSFTAFTAMLIELVLSLKAVSAMGAVQMTGIFSMAVGVLVLSASLKLLSSIDPGTIDTAIFAMGEILALVVAFGYITNALKVTATMSASGAGLAIMGGALLLFIPFLAIVSHLPAEGLGNAIKAIALIALIAAAFGELGSAGATANLTAGATALAIMGAAFLLFTPFIAIVGNLNLGALHNALYAMSAILVIAGIFGSLASGVSGSMIAASVGLIGMAIAIDLLTAAFIFMQSLSFESMAAGLIGVGLAIAVFAATATPLAAVAPAMILASAGIIAFSVAVTAIGGACIVAGLGMEFLGEGIQALVSGVVGALRIIVTAVADLIVGIVSAIETTISWIKKLFNATSVSTADFASGIEDTVKHVVETTYNDANNAGEKLAAGVSEGAKADMTSTGEETADTYVSGISNKTDEAESAGEEMSESTADGVEEAEPLVSQAGEFLVSGLLGSLSGGTASAYGIGYDTALSYLAGIQNGGEIASPSKAAKRLGAFMTEGFIIGMGKNMNNVYSTGKSTATLALEALSEAINDLNDDSITSPVIRPVLDLSNINNGTRTLNSIISDTNAFNANLNVSAKSENDTLVGLMRQTLTAIREGRVMYLDGEVVARNVDRRLATL